MPKLIGTAGHVDHGKTTLIKALTGIDADRLPEEKERGMTIDIGFASIDLPEVGRVSIVDVPGHERFIRNMLAGALGIDVALLCVAADEGVKPQTREHLQILELLPVQKMVVALTRADLADEDTRALGKEEVKELLSCSRFAKAQIIEVSAVTGEGLDELKSALQHLLQEEDEEKEGPWYLPIDRAFSVKGHGSVVTGTLARGRVHVGDTALIEPGHLETRIRSIQSHGEDVETGTAGARTALNLAGLKLEQLHRGQAIGKPGALFETRAFDAEIGWVAEPKHAQRVRVHLGAEEAIGKIFLNDSQPDLAQIRLETPVACARDQPLILRRYSPPDLLGGGRVLVPVAKPRRKSEKVSAQEATSLEESLRQFVVKHPQGVQTEEICRALGQTPQQLGEVFEKLSKAGVLQGFAGLWLGANEFQQASIKLQQALEHLHEQNPTKAGLPREAVVAKAGFKWAGKPLDRIIAALTEKSLIEQNGTFIKSKQFRLQLSPKQRSFLDRVVLELNNGGVNPPSTSDLTQALRVPPQAVDEILRLGIEAGEIERVGDGIFYSQPQLEKIKSQMREKFGANPFAAGDFRDSFGSSRKYVIPLLEHFDAVGFTLRVADKRVIRKSL